MILQQLIDEALHRPYATTRAERGEARSYMRSSRTVGNVFVYVTVEGLTVSNMNNVGQDGNYDRNVGSLCQS